ncbi:hypothetical protein FE783_17890 [Paenibacillus mesophilus]|uniref:hypothetical protein n=1 Tax=Paenibacillus mesophilus TaxID=2582849 RepID=UPI00110E40FB|nr:hypothetical protein [Paenibacillus mesophilus]TMV48388.1 hypothetical protein FE783_17890 [Paenibacillus mesophilus]
MRSNRMLILVIAELFIAVAFAATSTLVFIYERNDVWIQAILVLGGIAGLLNGAYLLRLRSKPPARRRPGKPKR